MSTPAPLTPAQITAIQQKFDLASAKSYPGQFMELMTGLTPKSPTAIFLFTQEPDGSTIMSNATLSQAHREERADKFVAQGYGALMLYELCWRGSDHYEVFDQWSSDGIKWYPPRLLNGKVQPNLGQPGQYALPGADTPGIGLLGPYPTTQPDGWIRIPPVAELLVPGADVDGLLKAWFGGGK